MNKNKEGRDNDIYDNASTETIVNIDSIYEDALSFLGEHKRTKHIPIIRFENNFSMSVENNLKRLIEFIRVELED